MVANDPRIQRLLRARRRALAADRTPLPAIRRPRPGEDVEFDAMIAAEWKLARRLAAVAATLPQDDPERERMDRLRTEIEDAALTLRLVARRFDAQK